MFPPHPLSSRLSHLCCLLGFFRHLLPLRSHRAHLLHRTAGTHCRHPALPGAPNPLRRFPPVSAPKTCEITPQLSAIKRVAIGAAAAAVGGGIPPAPDVSDAGVW